MNLTLELQLKNIKALICIHKLKKSQLKSYSKSVESKAQ